MKHKCIFFQLQRLIKQLFLVCESRQQDGCCRARNVSLARLAQHCHCAAAGNAHQSHWYSKLKWCDTSWISKLPFHRWPPKQRITKSIESSAIKCRFQSLFKFPRTKFSHFSSLLSQIKMNSRSSQGTPKCCPPFWDRVQQSMQGSFQLLSPRFWKGRPDSVEKTLLNFVMRLSHTRKGCFAPRQNWP